MSEAIRIADAVVAELAAAPPGTFDETFTPQRRVLPTFELSELAGLHVTVVPRAVEITTVTRSGSQYDVQVDIGIQKKLGKDLDGEVEPLMELTEQIALYLRLNPLQTAMDAHWLQCANEPIYAADHLAEKRLFTSVLTLTYRVMK